MARRRRRRKGPTGLIHEVDLHGLTWPEAERRLRSVPTEAGRLNRRVVKIIHGWGSMTGRSVLQGEVRRWLARNPFPFRAMIPGENYHIGDPDTVAMRDALGTFPDPDFGAGNEGVTLVWLR